MYKHQNNWSIYAIAAVGNLVPEKIVYAYHSLKTGNHCVKLFNLISLHAKELTSVLQILYIPDCFKSIKEG